MTTDVYLTVNLLEVSLISNVKGETQFFSRYKIIDLQFV